MNKNRNFTTFLKKNIRSRRYTSNRKPKSVTLTQIIYLSLHIIKFDKFLGIKTLTHRKTKLCLFLFLTFFFLFHEKIEIQFHIRLQKEIFTILRFNLVILFVDNYAWL